LCLLFGFSGKYSVSNNNEINDYIFRLKQQCLSNILAEEENKTACNPKKNKSSRFNIFLPLAVIIVYYFVLLLIIYMR
ncbi:DotU family type IV/VI secretion system protein, partial [Escherichia coli]|nr:DotU family type IV/VI secretion system protein [Escherichia coli]